jgi:hypothetical protein
MSALEDLELLDELIGLLSCMGREVILLPTLLDV